MAEQTGRLLRLQGNVSAAQIQRRICEKYGERQTVSRRVQYVIRGFVDWEILKDSSRKGVYTQGNILSITNPKIISWLVEAVLLTRLNGSSPINDLLGSTSLFPFKLTTLSAENLIKTSPRLDLFHHSLDNDLIMLR